ncbi:3-isopropylmalate dehydratase large subunit [Spirochaeta africana]|uniref:3-isopropylmalate dehydratase large subunit n=1 Tax=Spirochaeta africana (strain ATCC 700263 / DSM 8902 / Z-7692) TaxID=889378 RepID=H9ULI3_SPIAZ|nr:3-isopropylmalate dehydratase large subunit [Spirochaeta africana]AFG38376.1 3-isopropylmalate dehydratase, large subunit [Spirochaeta africana DSM 8902]
MAKRTLYNKVWDQHAVTRLPSGQTQLFIGLHMVHEVTSPQAFDMLRERGLKVAYPERTFATMDHIVPTRSQQRPFADSQAELMMQAIEKNTKEFGVNFFNFETGKQGIVHIIGPEMGLTQPGMTIACGDSHTSTHGAFGTLAFGIGTSQVRDVLASQCLAMDPMKVRRIEINGELKPGVTPKDVILYIINRLGVKGGLGYAYEYAGDVFDNMSMEGRMTVCNMSIEGGARAGYVNPDDTTFDYLKGREYCPQGAEWDAAVEKWRNLASDADAEYDDVVVYDAADIEPMVTWGVTPGQSVGISQTLPDPAVVADSGERKAAELAFKHMSLQPGQDMKGVAIDVAFLGSCTNGRIEDLRAAAEVVRGQKVAESVHAFVVPGSMQVAKQAVKEGLHQIFMDAGFEWRAAGCSMCLAMNPDKLQGNQISASSSNRNFIGRQGSSTGRTLLMSPQMVAAAAITGKVVDIREFAGSGAKEAVNV